MPTIDKHAPGTFCWIELATTDGDGAKRFYTELFGWDSRDDPISPDMVYTMFQRHGKTSAAGYQMGAEMKAMNVPPHWLEYIAVESADETVEKARSLGATVIREPMDVFDIGRMAVLQGPTGAHFAIWQANKAQGLEVLGEPNTYCWAELATRDSQKAQAFYTELFGWSAKRGTAAPMEYTEFALGGAPFAGMLEMDEKFGDAPPHWLTYFAVEDCDASAAKAGELGGTAIVPPSDIPNVGRFSVHQDPQGAVFALVHLTDHDG